MSEETQAVDPVDGESEQTPAPTVSPPQQPDDSAYARLRREAEEAKREAQAAKTALAERERAEAEEAGRFKELYEKEQARSAQLEAAQKAAENRRLAERTAADLKFKDAGYALYLLDQDRVDLADAAAVKARLGELAASRTDLVGAGAPPLPSGGPAGGPQNNPSRLTREQIAAMSPQKVAALDEDVLNEALAG